MKLQNEHDIYNICSFHLYISEDSCCLTIDSQILPSEIFAYVYLNLRLEGGCTTRSTYVRIQRKVVEFAFVRYFQHMVLSAWMNGVAVRLIFPAHGAFCMDELICPAVATLAQASWSAF